MGERQRQRQNRGRRSVRGFFLIGVFFLIALLSTLIATGLTRSSTEQAAATRFADHEQAFQLAEAGVDDALRILKTSSVEWNDELIGLDGIASTADDGILPFGLTVNLASGSYTVKLSDNDDERAPDRKSTRLNSSHNVPSRLPSSA